MKRNLFKMGIALLSVTLLLAGCSQARARQRRHFPRAWDRTFAANRPHCH